VAKSSWANPGVTTRAICGLVAAFLLALLFIYVPGIDLWAARLFYRDGHGFFLRHYPTVEFVYEAVPVIVWTLALGGLLLIVINASRAHWKAESAPFLLSNRVVLYLLLTLALGPGLLCKVFQDQWGRARPREVMEFGGARRFTPAFIPSDQCEKNCSFVSSHASVGFYLVTLSFIARRHRKILAMIALLTGGVVGAGRMAQGAHFLSDVVFAGLLTYMVAYLLYLLLIRRLAAAQPPNRVRPFL
jgi:lipid A 4'-phosphatase